MPNQQIPYGDLAQFAIPTGLDSGSNPAALGSLTATVSDYTHFYGGISGTSYDLVPRTNLPVGVNTTVTVTFNGTDKDGGTLPPAIVSLDFVGNVAAPLATSISVVAPVAGPNGGLLVPNDPGSATTTLV